MAQGGLIRPTLSLFCGEWVGGPLTLKGIDSQEEIRIFNTGTPLISVILRSLLWAFQYWGVCCRTRPLLSYSIRLLPQEPNNITLAFVLIHIRGIRALVKCLPFQLPLAIPVPCDKKYLRADGSGDKEPRRGGVVGPKTGDAFTASRPGAGNK